MTRRPRVDTKFTLSFLANVVIPGAVLGLMYLMIRWGMR